MNSTATAKLTVNLVDHGGPDVMELVEEPVGPLEPGKVRIAVEAIGVNFGDILVRQGNYLADAPLSMRPGFEVAGRVLDPGDADLRAGGPVVAFVPDGGYATVVDAPARQVVGIPDEIGAVQAAGLLIQGITAWYAVRRFGAVAAGDLTLVHAAAGGVGGIAMQLAKRLDARPIATASTEAKRAATLARGAEAAISSDPDTLTEELRGVLGGSQLDVVLDGVGGPLFRPSLRALGTGGRYVVYGAASQEGSKLDARALMPKAQTLNGFVVAAVLALDPKEPGFAFGELARMLATGELEHEITTLPFADLQRAHELLESRQLVGKIVLRP